MLIVVLTKIQAARGTDLRCKGWRQEGILRMLENTLENSERPEELIVYGATGKVARNRECYDSIVKTLMKLEDEETLAIQSGKPVAVFKTQRLSPRVLIANTMLVPRWATWETYYDLEKRGLIMYGQYTAGSWAYIGTQGVIQTTYETMAAVARKFFQGTLAGKFVLTSGMGPMGGNQPLAVAMNGGVCLVVEPDERTIRRRAEAGYCDKVFFDLDEALDAIKQAVTERKPLGAALLGNAAEVYPTILRKRIRPDVVTDMAPAHDPLQYLPRNMSPKQAEKLRRSAPKSYIKRASKSAVEEVRAMLEFQRRGAVVFEYGNNIRGLAAAGGLKTSFKIRSFVTEFIRPLFCEGRGPFRWIALSGEKADLEKTENMILKEFSNDATVTNWIKLAKQHIPIEGLPARICWLDLGERAHFAKLVNHMVKDGELTAPIAVSRDNMDTGSVAQPTIETESMLDGSDAIGDWAILNGLLNVAAMADLVAIQQGGGSGMGGSLHTGMSVILDGTEESEFRAERVFKTDPGIGVVRYADAGYERARKMLADHGVKAPLV